MGASLAACFMKFRFRLSARIACGKVSRAPPCTRKGHRPLTRIGAKLTFCLFRFYLLGWVGGSRLIPYCRLTAKGRKPDGLLYRVRFSPGGGDCLAAMGASLAACFMKFRFRLAAGIALRQWTQAWRLAL